MDNNAFKEFMDDFVNTIKSIWGYIKKLASQLFNYLKRFSDKKNKRLVYLSIHSKKYRVRKKNIHRLMRC